jgi:hypothetical protein
MQGSWLSPPHAVKQIGVTVPPLKFGFAKTRPGEQPSGLSDVDDAVQIGKPFVPQPVHLPPESCVHSGQMHRCWLLDGPAMAPPLHVQPAQVTSPTWPQATQTPLDGAVAVCVQLLPAQTG